MTRRPNFSQFPLMEERSRELVRKSTFSAVLQSLSHLLKRFNVRPNLETEGPFPLQWSDTLDGHTIHLEL